VHAKHEAAKRAGVNWRGDIGHGGWEKFASHELCTGRAVNAMLATKTKR
jgi:hypothetical protein